jgi:alanyl-tRNA synthetase
MASFKDNVELDSHDELNSSISASSCKWPVSKVRNTFIDFYVKKKGHVFFPSSPVVPVNDPTLLFSNSGSHSFY